MGHHNSNIHNQGTTYFSTSSSEVLFDSMSHDVTKPNGPWNKGNRSRNVRVTCIRVAKNLGHGYCADDLKSIRIHVNLRRDAYSMTIPIGNQQPEYVKQPRESQNDCKISK